MGKDFQLRVFDEREAEYRDIFGSATVCVKSPIMELVKFEGDPEPVGVYMLDMELIDDLTHDRLVASLAQKFGESEEAITQYIGEHGLPIKAVNTVLTILNPQKWLLDDQPDAEELEKFDIMSDLDDGPEDEFDGYGDYE